MVALNDDYTEDDFENLFYCFNMLQVAYGAVGNLYAVTHYLKEINKDEIILPEEIKDIQFDLEMNINELEMHTDNWYKDAIVTNEEGLPELGPKFAVWRLKLRKERLNFKTILDSRLKWIKKRLTMDSNEISSDFTSLVKKLSTGISQDIKEGEKELD